MLFRSDRDHGGRDRGDDDDQRAADDGQQLLFGIYHDITAEKNAQRRIETYEAELRHLAWEIALSEERERHRIAGVLHDEIGFELASLYQSIGTLSPGEVQPDFQKAASDSLRNAISQIRSLTREISNPALYAGGMEVELRSLMDQVLTPADIEAIRAFIVSRANKDFSAR